MKKMMIVIAVLAVASSAHAAYTYTYGPGTDFGSLDLNGHESVLVNGGGYRLTLFDWTTARITSTTHLNHPYTSDGHGIPEIDAVAYSNLTIAGGEIGNLYAFDYTRITISGGSIDYLRGRLVPPIPAVPPDKYIQVICKSHSYNTGTKLLTGVWGDDSTFSIQLVDTSPWPSGFSYDSINFVTIPEPLSLALLALGGLLARKYPRR